MRPKTDKQILADLYAEILADAPRTEPRCPHAGDCGGCSFQHIDYSALVDAKRTVALRLAARADAGGLLAGVPVDACPSPLPFGYRQRMDFVCAFGSSGLRRRRRHREVVGLTACPLLGAEGFAAFARAVALARALGWPDYDYLRHTGDLRYVVIRQTRAGDRLVSLVSKTADRRDDAEKIAAALLAEGHAKGVYWLCAPGLGDVSFGEPAARWGEETIMERLGDLTFRLGPNTFFQANPCVAEMAYQDIARAAADAGPGDAVDLYSGAGAIACWLARAGRRVTAVENLPDNVRLAAANFAANGVADRIGMIEADAGLWLRGWAAAVSSGRSRRAALATVNPPRPGVDEAGREALSIARPGTILYLSCNAATLWRDVAYWSRTAGYRVDSVRVYDMFPQTPHFETLAVLRS